MGSVLSKSLLPISIVVATAGCGEDTLFAEVGAGGTATSSQSAGGATGGGPSTGGGGGASTCEVGTTMECYSGPPRTKDVGPCHAGAAICQPDGMFGACMGEVLPATEQCATPADEDCNGVSETCVPGQPVWAKKFADPNPAAPTSGEGLSVASDSMGNVLVTGAAGGGIDFGGGPLTPLGATDVVLVKLDSAGNHVWSKRFGSMSADYGRDVAADAAGGVWLTGDFIGTIDFGGDALQGGGAYLAKFDAQGNHLWSKAFGDPSGKAIAVAVDSNGAAIITGYFQGTIDFGGGPLTAAGVNDVYVAKFNAQGAHVWSKRFGDTYNQGPFDIAVDPAGNVVLSSYYDGAPDFGGGPVPFTNNGLVLVKIAPGGNHLATGTFAGGSSFLSPVPIAVDTAGNVALAGGLYGTVSLGGSMLVSAGNDDVFAAKLTASGGHLFSARYGDTNGQSAYSAAVDGAGNVLLCGSQLGTVNFGGSDLVSGGYYDVFVAKLSSTGSHVFSANAGDSGGQLCWGVASDPTGHLLATGHFTGTLDIGTVPPLIANTGSYDIFVVKLQP